MTKRRVSVLIVEDERIVARDLQQTLNDIGHDAFAVASSGEEAVTIASRRRPDVALMDIRIRGAFDGIQTARALRSLYDVPVIYLTAHADAAIMERAERTAPVGYLLKPVRTAELQSTIELLLYKIRSESSMRHKERWFFAALQHLGEGVIFVDDTLSVTFLNAQAQALLGASAVQAVARPVEQVVRLEVRPEVGLEAGGEHGSSETLGPLGGGGRPELERALMQALRDNEVVSLEPVTVLTESGRRKLQVRVVPLSDEGRGVGAVLLLGASGA